jgi:molecular chaperone GrpE
MAARHHRKGKSEAVKKNVNSAMEKAAKMAEERPVDGELTGREAVVPEDELRALREKASKGDEYYDRMLRTMAELENYRKRAGREREEILKYGQEELIAELLLVMDNFQRALDAAGGKKECANLFQGVELIQKQLLSVLKKNGLEPIEAVGKPFDPQKHEALSQVVTDECPDGTVVSEQLRGYMLNGRLLRPSAVVVAKSPDEGEVVSGDETEGVEE